MQNNFINNYDKAMQDAIDNLSGGRRLLLHTCCGVCAAGALSRLDGKFDVSLYFYNPNLDSSFEYDKRSSQLYKLSQRFDIKDIIIEKYNPQEFLGKVENLLSEPEGGKRCPVCFGLRLEKTARFAFCGGYDFFATTLTLSPHKNAHVINQIGLQCQKDYINSSAKYLVSDFKKHDGFKTAIKLSYELSIYRQSYCGCKP